MYNNQYNIPYQSNILPPQQILQANGRASIEAIRMSPNSSVLIADTTAPIVWKCMSDSLGNVTKEPFDIVPHKDEAQIEKENLNALVLDMNNRLKELEVKYESVIEQSTKSNDTKFQTDKADDVGNKKSTNYAKSNAQKQS
jgi:hypothetical protein